MGPIEDLTKTGIFRRFERVRRIVDGSLEWVCQILEVGHIKRQRMYDNLYIMWLKQGVSLRERRDGWLQPITPYQCVAF